MSQRESVIIASPWLSDVPLGVQTTFCVSLRQWKHSYIVAMFGSHKLATNIRSSFFVNGRWQLHRVWIQEWRFWELQG